jgi:hypothetical protein
MKLNNFLIFLFCVLLLVIIINCLIIVFGLSYLGERITGHASGYVNFTINTAVLINLSIDTLDWGSGVVDSGQLNATLTTNGGSSGFVKRGNWTGENAKAFIVQNIGSINCSLFIQTEKNAHDFFESASNSNEEYKINVSNKKIGSCSGGVLGQWIDANKTSGGTKYCSQFSFNSASNELYIDVLITVPVDSNKVDEQSDTLTITGNAAN